MQVIGRILLAGLIVGGCSVRVPIEEADAVPLPPVEVTKLVQSGEGASVPGTWFRLNAILNRKSARKVARWELYTHVQVEQCHTDRLVSVLDNVQVQGTENFSGLRELLNSNTDRAEFSLTGPIFIQHGESTENLCARLDGGSYTLQKIASDQVPLLVREFPKP